jgi:putative ABC transport system permease protein
MSGNRRSVVAAVLIRAAAPLVPASLRDDWRREWDAELASLEDVRPKFRRPVRRAFGAFADAFWLRQRSVADFDWIDDLRHGMRQLLAHRGFALTAIGILAVGLASTVTMFSVTDQILLRPLPYPDGDRIVTAWETRAPSNDPLDVAPANFLDWRARLTSFDVFAGVEPWAVDYVGGQRPETFRALRVTPGFFETFGVAPMLGRAFTPDEYQKGRDKVIILHEPMWRQRFGGDPAIVGQSLKFDDGLYTVVGIMPASFEPRLLATIRQRNLWLPKVIEEFEPRIRGTGYWAVVGRVRPDVTLAAAEAELAAVARQLAAEYPRTNAKTGARLLALRDHLVGNVRLAVTLLAGAVALVLVIACVNVANLLLARGSAREREIAIRVALGARRIRILQQLLNESLLIAACGGVLGLLLASWSLSALANAGPASVPWIDTLHLDWRALVFAAGMSVGVALISGIVPAWRVARAGLHNAGRQTATADSAQHRLRSGLVVAEVALALVLVTGAGLMMRSFVSLMRVDPGFERDNVMVAQVFASDFFPNPDALRQFFSTTIDRLEALPAVQAAGAVSAMPFIESNINIQNTIVISGRRAPETGETPRAYLTIATPGYFDAMHIPLKAGRLLEARDGPDSKPVAVITDSLALRHWNTLDAPIGQTLTFQFAGRDAKVEVVGVVASLRHDRLDRPAREELFMPHAQMPFGSMTFVVRTAGDASALLSPVQATIWDVNPAQSIYRAATLDELVENTVSPRRFALAVIIAFAGVALLLAIGGVYGVLSAITTARLREVGVRVALGASGCDIVRWVLGRGLTMAGVGLAVGLAGSLGAAQLLRSFLFQIAPIDPAAFAAASATMIVAAIAACYVPARRAAQADPITVLRTD